MADFERVASAIRTLGDACCELLNALCDWTYQTANELLTTIDFGQITEMKDAYNQAKIEHPEWVHRAYFCKRKRIRKKYHDKIMREYRGG